MYLAAKLRLKLVSIRLAPYYVPIAADLVFPRYTTYSEQVYCYHVIHVRAIERKKNEEDRPRENQKWEFLPEINTRNACSHAPYRSLQLPEG